MRTGNQVVLGAVLALAGATAAAAGPHDGPACEPGYTIVEEVCYKEVVKKFCKVVPDVKKTQKWVYSCKSEDFCLPKCSCPLHGHKKCDTCAQCLECDGPMTKCLLVKKLVTTECPTSKCVVETVVEKVPYVVYRKVPCGPGAAAPAPEVLQVPPARATTAPK